MKLDAPESNPSTKVAKAPGKIYNRGNKSLSIYLSTYLPIYLSTYLPIYLSTYLPIYLSTYLPIYLSTYLPIYLSTYLPIYLSTYLPTYLPIYLSTYLAIYLSIYLSIIIYLYIDYELQIPMIFKRVGFYPPPPPQKKNQSKFYPTGGICSFAIVSGCLEFGAPCDLPSVFFQRRIVFAFGMLVFGRM